MGQRIEFSLDLPPGRWQVVWFGSVETSPISASAFVINTFFRRYPPVGAARQWELRQVSLPHMHLLPMGMVLGGAEGELEADFALTPREEFKSLSVDLSPENIDLVARSELPFAARGRGWSHPEQYEAFFLRARATDACPEVFIPCACLLQFYWGTSSAMADAVLAGGLEQPERTLYRAEGTRSEPDGTFFLELRKQWTDDEAPYIATLLETPGALAAGRHTYRSIVTQMQAGAPTGPFKLEVWPPFQRVSSLYVRASQPLNSRGEPSASYLVTRVRSADLTPPWTKLIFSRETDSPGVTGGHDAAPLTTGLGGENTARAGIVLVPGSTISVSETPSGYAQSGMTIKALQPINSRFPDLGSLDVSKVAKPDASVALASLQFRTRRWPRSSKGPWSAIPGPVRLGARALRAKVGADERASFPAPGSGECAQDCVDEQLAQLCRLLTRVPRVTEVQGRPVRLDIEFWDPYAEDHQPAESPLYFAMPRTIDDRRLTWLFRDPEKKLTKRGVCVRLHLSDGATTIAERFLVDLERRRPAARGGKRTASPINSSILVVWSVEPMTLAVSKAALRDVLKSVALRGNPAINERPVPGVCLGTVRHMDSEVHPLRLVERLFACRDRCTDTAPILA